MKDTSVAADAEAVDHDQLLARRSAPEGEQQQQEQPPQQLGIFEDAFAAGAAAANHIFQPVSFQTRGRKQQLSPLEETADVNEEDFEEEQADVAAVHQKANYGNAVDSPLNQAVNNGPAANAAAAAAYDDGDDLADEPALDDVARAEQAHSRGKC